MEATENDITITITDLAFGGNGVGRFKGKVCFVPGTIPGEEVKAMVVADRKNYAEGLPVTNLSPSPERRLPPCPLFGVCGGCSWQHISYSAQLKAKRRILEESLRRIGGITDPAVSDVLPSPREYGYRNRMRFAWIPGTGLGLYRRGTRDAIPVRSCLIIEEALNRMIPDVNDRLLGETDRAGTMERVDLSLDDSGRAGFSLQTERDAGGEFSQVNREVNAALRSELAAAAARVIGRGKRGQAPVIDLFCGDGNLSLPLAEAGFDARGYDLSWTGTAAANDAVRNLASRIPGIRARYERVDVYREFGKLREVIQGASLVIADPPRAGLGSLAAETAALRVPAIIYVSCNPPILAKDLRIFTENGYYLHSIMPFDMFPQTFHLESMSILTFSRSFG
jgi:23S rRNA (uracil1939-C5)-methyltransferase